MKVHNLMEEYVEVRVRDLYQQLEKQKALWLSCSCENCIMDSISYVLNRTAPHYVVSGRGVVYTSQALDNHQLRADVDALCLEAVRTVNTVQRPYHKIISKINQTENASKPHFNFPVISGSVFNGDTFEPVINAEVTLKDKNGLVLMQDFSWSNPSKTFTSTKGAFSFWPQAIEAEKEDDARKFDFTLEIKAQGYQTQTKFIEITLTSESEKKTQINHTYTMKIQDVILFKNA